MLEFNKSQHLENEEMGEVRVKVKLTNSIDEELVKVILKQLLQLQTQLNLTYRL